MANDVIDMSAFQGKRPSQAFNFVPQGDSLADGIGSSYGVLSYKGKVWSLRYRGERKTFLRPDDGTPASYLDVVIVGQAKQKSKSFYDGYNDASAGERPLCSSIDGVTPDADARQKQADSCALCPRNVWKTNDKGKKTRECSDYKRLAVLVMPNQTKPLFPEPLMEPVFLRVPPASLNSLANMGTEMDANGWHYSTYVTRITFDHDKPHPEMIFRPIQGLGDAEAPIIEKLMADPTVGRITGGDITLPAGNPSNVVRLVQPTAPPAPAIERESGMTLLGAPVKVSAPGEVAGTAPPPVAGPLLELQASPPPPPAAGGTPVAPAAQTAADTGEPEEADADLDARLASLFPK